MSRANHLVSQPFLDGAPQKMLKIVLYQARTTQMDLAILLKQSQSYWLGSRVRLSINTAVKDWEGPFNANSMIPAILQVS